MSPPKQWTHDEICRLIEAYESHPILWDIKERDYKNRVKKNLIIEKLAIEFETNTVEINRKIHNLRNQVSQELKKMKNKKSGSGTSETKTWCYFSALSFIVPSLEATPSQCNLMPSTSNTVEPIDLANATVPSDEASSEKLYGKKRKRDHLDNDGVIKAALEVLARNPDEHDKFGEYVACELRSLKFDNVRRKLKTQIRQSILTAVQEEDAYLSSPASSSYAILSPPPPPTTPSPLPTNPIFPENNYPPSQELVESYDFINI